MNRRKFLVGLFTLGGLITVVKAAPVRLPRKETTGIDTDKVKWAKKNFNPSGQLQERLEIIEKMLGLRDIE